jgi:hydroxypyruvate reductase
MNLDDLREIAAELQQSALRAVDPEQAVKRHVQSDGQSMTVDGQAYDLDRFQRIFVLAAGKAAVPMSNAIADRLGERLTEGIIVTKYGHGAGSTHENLFHLIEAGHPVPDEHSVRGARAIANLATEASEADLVICLISGGGSALLTLPVLALGLEGFQSLTDGLLRSGATINELNTVRKHCSQIKGGNLARLAAPATTVTLILSDVVGDPLEVIASGPTVPDPTTVADARRVLTRRGIQAPGGAEDGFSFLQETPKADDPAFHRVRNVLVASNRLAAVAATQRARKLGLATQLLGTYVEGEAREVAKVAAAFAKGVRAHGDPLPPPACLVWGGETTVTVTGQGKGGRNQELALAAALALDGWPGILMMALATDGTDGPTDAAGGIVTGETMARARAMGLDAWKYLEANDSYHVLDRLGALIQTGPTGTNVNDLLFILVADEVEA